MRFAGGWLVVGQWRGAPVRLHWTIPVGAVVLTRFAFAPIYWVLFPMIVLVHEFGHAWMVVRARSRVVSIDAHGMGGTCTWHGTPTAMERAGIAWGGVLAQAVLLVAALLVEALAGMPTSTGGWEAHQAMVRTNAAMIVLNLMPVGGLDGVEAWKILPLLRARLAPRLRGVREGLRRRAVRASAGASDRIVQLRVGPPTEDAAEEAERLMEEVRAEARARGAAKGEGPRRR